MLTCAGGWHLRPGEGVAGGSLWAQGELPSTQQAAAQVTRGWDPLPGETVVIPVGDRARGSHVLVGSKWFWASDHPGPLRCDCNGSNAAPQWRVFSGPC